MIALALAGLLIQKTIKNQFFEPADELEIAGSVQPRLSHPFALGSPFMKMRSPLRNREEGVRVALCEQLCMRRTASRRFCCFPCCKCFERRRRRAAEKKQLGAADSLLGAQVPTSSIRDRSVF